MAVLYDIVSRGGDFLDHGVQVCSDCKSVCGFINRSYATVTTIEMFPPKAVNKTPLTL